MKEVKNSNCKIKLGLPSFCSGSIGDIVFQKNGRVRIKPVRAKKTRNLHCSK